MKSFIVPFLVSICCYTAKAAFVNRSDYTEIQRFLSTMFVNEPPPALFPSISHPYPPIYADLESEEVVPTNSWLSNLFYPSVQNLAPTTPDPYILRLLDDFGGNPGLSISQPSTKVIKEKRNNQERH